MDRKLIESHFKLFRKVIQLQNFHKDIKEKGTSKCVINLEQLEDIINEAREINKHYSEFPESEKLRPQVKVFSREECVWQYCPYGEETCRKKCAHKYGFNN